MKRRLFLASAAAMACQAQEATAPIEMPRGFLRKPNGSGRFPAVILIHGGLQEVAMERLKAFSASPTPTRFVSAGYAVALITYRSRDQDPQSGESLQDCMAALQYVRMLPYVDSRSVIVYGCSGGGDLALEIAAAGDVCAIVAEEPASMIFTGVFTNKFPKKGDRYTPEDFPPEVYENPKAYYKKANEKMAGAKIGRIRCPILIVQGDKSPVNKFNAAILIPELKMWEKKLEVITYPGQTHCFGFTGQQGSDKLFRDVDAFCKRNLPGK